MFEKFQGAVRRIDADALDTYFTVSEGPRRVGRDGVRYRNILYTLEAEDLVKLQGRQVWILPNLDNAGLIALCDKDEKLLCYGVQQQLVKAGAKDQDFRAAMAKAARVRRLAKSYLPERDFLLQTTTGRILAAKREHALAEEASRRKQQPAPAAPTAVIVRPDLVESARRVRRKSEAAVRAAARMGSSGGQTALERLIQRGREEEAAERNQPAVVSRAQRFATLNYETNEEREAAG